MKIYGSMSVVQMYILLSVIFDISHIKKIYPFHSIEIARYCEKKHCQFYLSEARCDKS